MQKNSLIKESEKNSEILEDVDIALVAPVRRHQSRFILSIHERDLHFYDIQVGDEVHLRIDKVKKQKRPVYLGEEGQ
jgi:hypothetical protein